MAEKELQQKIVRYLTSTHNAFVRKTVATSARGFPDLVVVLRGGVFFIEVKTRTGRVSKLQAATHKQIRAAGGLVLVARSLDDVRAFIEEHQLADV